MSAVAAAAARRAARALLPLLLLAACARCDEVTSSERYARLHPAYHVAPARNWMNDPVGIFYYLGLYHLFFQYNPGGSSWGNISWAHVASADLATWRRLPLAPRLRQ